MTHDEAVALLRRCATEGPDNAIWPDAAQDWTPPGWAIQAVLLAGIHPEPTVINCKVGELTVPTRTL